MATNFRSRCWVATLNNYDLDDIESIKALTCDYCIVGDEVGESGTPHLQCYFRFKSARTLSALKKKLSTAHFEVALGNDLQNREYCSKQSILYETGKPSSQGKRTDLEKITTMMDDGVNSMRELLPHLRSTQSVRMAEIRLKYFEKKRTWKPEVLWFHGSTGTGKSRLAYDMTNEPFTCLDTIKWWEGYDAHEDVIIDDLRSDFCKYNDFLKLIDRYAYQVECKGGSRQLLARRIIITSPYRPEYIWRTAEDPQQLLRRIDTIRDFDEEGYYPTTLENLVTGPAILLED